MRVNNRLGGAISRIDYAAPDATGADRPSWSTLATSPEHSNNTAPETDSSIADGRRGAWTAAWCRPLDTAVALLVLFAIALVANGLPHPDGIADFLALRVSLKNALLLSAFVVMWPLMLTAAGAYDETKAWSLRSEMVCVVLGCAAGSTLASLIPLLSNSGKLDWGSLPILWVGTVTGTLGVRLSARLAAYVHKLRSVARHVVIAGTGPRAAKLWSDLRHHPLIRYELLAVSDVDDATINDTFHGQMLVPVTELESYFMHTAVDEVHVALPVRSRYREIEQILRVCEHGGVHSRYLADTFSSTIARQRVSGDRGAAVVSMHIVHDDWRLLIKRTIDFLAASAGLLLLSPVLVAIALAIKFTSRGRIVFSQERYGFRKRRFKMYKFRTMVSNAEYLQAALEHKNEVDGPVFKIKNDPRVTRIGSFLRKTSLDELPQLWNVVKGDMSLVGPRPLPLRDVSRFNEAWLMRRFSVRPGLTCLWQISGRSGIGFDEWVQLDLKYIDSWSLSLDANILIRTIPAVLRGKGAS